MHTLRLLKKEEKEFLLDMIYESVHISENKKPSRDELLNEKGLKKYHEDWGKEGDKAFIALDQYKQPIGAVWHRLFDSSNKGYGFIDEITPELGIAIMKNARGLGIGTELMKKIIEEAKKDCYPSLSLSVDPENEQAVQIYKKLGFREVEIVGTSVTMVLLFS
ncbi:GNAT family N-acetyltransferase [Niallia sp. 03133]|uniref:GNAT family N-acetyltransferase n=1 Tax=Niallia sp. 03133 TaxID=3458060 RepID=UPI004044D8BC